MSHHVYVYYATAKCNKVVTMGPARTKNVEPLQRGIHSDQCVHTVSVTETSRSPAPGGASPCTPYLTPELNVNVHSISTAVSKAEQRIGWTHRTAYRQGPSIAPSDTGRVT